MVTTLERGSPRGAILSKCKATRIDGQPCAAYAGPSGYCFWHNPDRQEDRLEASRNGGSHRGLSIPVDTPLTANESRGILASVLAALLSGAIDSNIARSVAYILQVERKIAEGEELEQRIANLEALIASKRY